MNFYNNYNFISHKNRPFLRKDSADILFLLKWLCFAVVENSQSRRKLQLQFMKSREEILTRIPIFVRLRSFSLPNKLITNPEV